MHVAGKAGGAGLFILINATLLMANVGSGAGAHLGAARLLYGMGRSNALPAFFAAVDPRSNIPRNNVILVGLLAMAGGLLLTYQLGAELLNFGAFIAFMGVNLAALVRYGVRGDGGSRRLGDILIPLGGSSSASTCGGASARPRRSPAPHGWPSVSCTAPSAAADASRPRRTRMDSHR